MPFDVVPSVHAVDRTFPDVESGERPLDTATRLARAFGSIFVVDVEGVRRNKPDIEFLRELCRNRPVWLDSGVRETADAMDALVAGAERVAVRWPTFLSAAELEDLADMASPDVLYVMVEHDKDGFMRNPREPGLDAAAVARLAREHGLGVIVAAPAFDAHLARQFAGEPDTWWYGVVTRTEATELRRLAYTGAIVPAPLGDEAAAGGADAEVDAE